MFSSFYIFEAQTTLFPPRNTVVLLVSYISINVLCVIFERPTADDILIYSIASIGNSEKETSDVLCGSVQGLLKLMGGCPSNFSGCGSCPWRMLCTEKLVFECVLKKWIYINSVLFLTQNLFAVFYSSSSCTFCLILLNAGGIKSFWTSCFVTGVASGWAW